MYASAKINLRTHDLRKFSAVTETEERDIISRDRLPRVVRANKAAMARAGDFDMVRRSFHMHEAFVIPMGILPANGLLGMQGAMRCLWCKTGRQ
jgi:hypothetical protein